ncbi:hypothetical protein D3C84_648930 [compost metagenome]
MSLKPRSEGRCRKIAQLFSQSQNSRSLCGYRVRLLAWVLSRWKKRVRAWPVSMMPRKPA